MTAVDRQALLSGTEPPPQHLQLNTRALCAYLAARLPNIDSDLSAVKFKGGQSNPTYLLTSSAQHYVLRRRPPGPLLPSAHAIDREYRVLTALSQAGYPVPRTYCFCADESVIGSAFYVVSYHPGRIFWNADLPGLEKSARTAIYTDLCRRLAELHQFDLRALGLQDFGPREAYVARNLARWSKAYRESQLVDVPDMNWLLQTLPQCVPRDEHVSLVHGDYGLYNIVIDAIDPQIDAVLDWEMATLGDPWVDLAHHARPWWEPPNTGGAASCLAEHELTHLGIPSLDAYIDGYCRLVGIGELPHRNFYLGYAQFRYAAMIQGILKRAAIGTAASGRVLHTQERVFAVAALARRTLTDRAQS